jgi:hypothetical protein
LSFGLRGGARLRQSRPEVHRRRELTRARGQWWRRHFGPPPSKDGGSPPPGPPEMPFLAPAILAARKTRPSACDRVSGATPVVHFAAARPAAGSNKAAAVASVAHRTEAEGVQQDRAEARGGDQAAPRDELRDELCSVNATRRRGHEEGIVAFSMLVGTDRWRRGATRYRYGWALSLVYVLGVCWTALERRAGNVVRLWREQRSRE